MAKSDPAIFLKALCMNREYKEGETFSPKGRRLNSKDPSGHMKAVICFEVSESLIDKKACEVSRLEKICFPATWSSKESMFGRG